MIRLLQDSLIIARRDFFAIVATPTFIFFLLAPLIMILFGAMGGYGAAQMGKSAGARREIIALVPVKDQQLLVATDAAMRRVASPMVPRLMVITPQANEAAQAKSLLESRDRDVSAVLFGGLDTPHVTYRSAGSFSATYLAELADRSVRARLTGLSPDKPVTKAVRLEIKAQAPRQSTQQASGYGAVFVIFLLTLMLAGQSVGMLAEEKSNKVIEILAAAVRLESVFFGKLIGLFAVALLFIAFWAGLLGLGVLALPITMQDILADYRPAIGLPLFFLFGTLYFTMAFMLLGAMFLGMGALASSMREIQMMSLPITALQVGMFALSNAAAANPGSGMARFAELFPFSSPFAMAARGATDPAVTPHLLGLAWQALWVSLVIYIASRLFRRGVLKSGGGSWFRRSKVASMNG